MGDDHLVRALALFSGVEIANPQKENGYTMIANEIMEALARVRISGEEWQVLSVIFRQTYGYHKKSDWISLSQFVLKTGLPKSSVCRATRKLLSKNVIYKKVNGERAEYGFHKDFSEWNPLTKKSTVDKKVNRHLQKSKSKGLQKSNPQKKGTNTKESTTKESTSSKQKKASRKVAPNPDVKKFIDAFYEAHKHVTGKPYKVKAQDGKLIKGLLGVYTIDELNVFAREYFTTADKFVTQQAGYSIGIFCSVIPKLIIATKDDDTSWMQRIKDEEVQRESE